MIRRKSVARQEQTRADGLARQIHHIQDHPATPCATPYRTSKRHTATRAATRQPTPNNPSSPIEPGRGVPPPNAPTHPASQVEPTWGRSHLAAPPTEETHMPDIATTTHETPDEGDEHAAQQTEQYCTGDRCEECTPDEECCEATCDLCPRVEEQDWCWLRPGSEDDSRYCSQHGEGWLNDLSPEAELRYEVLRRA